MELRLRLIAVVMAVMLTANCSSGYEQFYEAHISASTAPALLQYDGVTILLQGSGNALEDVAKFFQDGYFLIGTSGFSGPKEDYNAALQQGKKVGAELVVVSNLYERTARGVIPITTFSPNITQFSGNFSGHGAGGPIGGIYAGSATTQSRQTDLIPYSVDRYQHTALYFARGERRGLGLLVREIPISDRQRIGTNRGVQVVAVRKESPGFMADIVPGDIILALGVDEVFDTASYRRAFQGAQGREVPIQILRGGREIKKDIHIPPEGK